MITLPCDRCATGDAPWPRLLCQRCQDAHDQAQEADRRQDKAAAAEFRAEVTELTEQLLASQAPEMDPFTARRTRDRLRRATGAEVPA